MYNPMVYLPLYHHRQILSILKVLFRNLLWSAANEPEFDGRCLPRIDKVFGVFL